MAIFSQPASNGKTKRRNSDRLGRTKIRLVNFESNELKIEYPTQWIYKVIGSDFKKVKAACEEILQETEYSIEKSNSSSKGAYISVRVEVLVETEDIRNSIFNDLKQHINVKMVL